MGDGRLSRFVRALADGGGRADLGGKGASLARLWSAGLPVPEGFVVSVAAFRGYAAAGSMPVEVAAEVAAAYRALGAPPVAVRSSATTEDTADASYAGQHDSFLGVADTDAVLAAVERCWTSLHTERAVAYRSRRSGEEPGLAVVVQRMVHADAAGVLFTAHPVTGDDSGITINAAWGLGEALVGGEVTPDTLVVDRATGRVRDRTLSLGDQHGRSTLTDAEAERLAALGVRIEALDARPADVEWCRDGDDLWIVQARPITARGADGDPWNDSRAGDFLWTNTNVGEAIPDVMTPASWSFAKVFLRHTMATTGLGGLQGWGRIGGRVYLNVSVMRSLSGAVGLGERAFRRLTAEIFGRLPDDVAIPPLAVGRWTRRRGAAALVGHVLGEVSCTRHRREAFLAAHPERCERRRLDIADAGSGAVLSRLGADVLEPEFHRVCWVLAATTRAAGAWFVGTRILLRRLVDDADANALTSGLDGHGPLASLGLLEGLDRLARGRIDRETFARRHGHRGPREFELSAPRPAEDDAWVDRQLAERDGPAYRDLLAAAQRQRVDAWSDLARRHRWLAPLLRRAEAVWARTARDREGARDEVGRYLGVLRAYALRAGELTGLGADIFFLDAAEITRVLRGETVDRGIIAERRAAYAGYSGLPPYPTLIRGPFDPYAWTADARDTAQRDGPAVRGFPGSAGVVEGLVRVLVDAADGDQVRSGEVLVTTVTNIGWTPLFPRLAAVVTDVGAPLSHAAIVARELGIPAVVGCGDATRRLRTGDRVRVDGSAGTVEVLPVGEPASSPSSTAPTGTRPTSVSEEDG